MLPCCRYPANSNPTFSTFRQHGPGGGQGGGHGEAAHHGGRQCYATRHQDTRGHGRAGGRAHARYGASPSRKPSKYELDRLAARGRHARHTHNGDSKYVSACCVEREQRAASRAASRAGEASRSSSRASRGGYSQAEGEEGRGYSQAELDTSDHEIEIQLQCIAAASQHSEDSGGSQHSHRGCSVEDEDEIMVVEEPRPGHQQPPGPAQDLYSRQGPDSGESRAHSRNGYKSDGSHGSTQESPP